MKYSSVAMERNLHIIDTGIGGGGVYSKKCHQERLCSEVRPLTLTTFYIPCFTEKVPLSYTFCWQKVPLSHTYCSLEFYIPSYCCK